MSPAQRSDAPTQRSEGHDPDHTWGEDLEVHAWGHPPHAHLFGQLVHAISGRAIFTIHADDGRALSTHAIDDTSAIWVPPAVWHSARFEPDFSPSAHPLDLGPSQQRVLLLVVDTTVRAELLATQWRPDEWLPRTRAAVDAQSAGAAAPPPRPTGAVTRAIALALDTDPADDRDLDDWARELHTSAMSIRRAFKAETGLTWSAWRTQHRVHAAVERLRGGERPSRAAAAVGFSDTGLSAAVRRLYGCTPSALVPGETTAALRRPACV